MAKYKAYPEYKDSGVEWLGKIPGGWLLKKAKYIFQRVQRPLREIDGVVTAFRDGQVTLRTNRRTDGFTNSVKEIGYQGVRRNDLVIHAMDGFAGAIGVSDSDGKCSPVCSVCIPWENQSLNMHFYGYLVRQLAVTDFILSLAKGIRERSTEFRFSEFSGLMLPIPPIYEQNQIATFLNHETAKIDDLIAKQQQLIELLKEKRQAVISHAVTKGLNPDVPMKDSGVEWLGEVPEHWRISTPIKYLSSLKGRLGWQGLKADEYRDEGPYVVSSAHFNNYEIDWNSCPRVSLERYKLDSNIQLDIGDILLMKDGAAMGKLSYVDQLPGEACLNSHLLLFRPLMGGDEKTYDTKFMFYLMQTNHFQSFIKNNGTGSTFLGISQQAIGNHSLCLPPYNEQVKISDYLDNELSKIVRLETMQLEMKNLLTERRTALISAAVTGKIDVRDWVAPDTQDVEAPQEVTA